MNRGANRSCTVSSAVIAFFSLTVFAPFVSYAQNNGLRDGGNHSDQIYVKRLPWRVGLAAIDPASGSVMLAHENSHEISVARVDALEHGRPFKSLSVASPDQPHAIVFHHVGQKGRYIVRTNRGDLFWVDVATLDKSQSIQLGEISKGNPGQLRVGSASNLVYTTQSAGLNDPSIPSSLVAIAIESDPPRKVDIRSSKRLATSGQFAVSNDETSAIALLAKDHAEYFTLSRGTLGKPDEDYLRVSSTAREIRIPKDSEDLETLQVPILSGPQKSGFVIGRTVWTADAKEIRGTLIFQPTAVFQQEPWVAGIANLSLRVASLNDATTIGMTTLPNEMLRGLPDNDTIDEIGLPYAPIQAIVLPDVERSRVLVIIGDHVAIVPLSSMGLPQTGRELVLASRYYDEEIDIEQFALSPDNSRMITLAGGADSAFIQTLTLYDRSTSKSTARLRLTRKIVSVAMDNEAVYIVDVDGIVTKLDLDTLQPASELGFRCRSLSIIDTESIFVDGGKNYLKATANFAKRPEPIADSSVDLPNQRLGNGWMVDGAYRSGSPEDGSIGVVRFLFTAANFVSTPASKRDFDYWNNAYPQAKSHDTLQINTRATGTLLSPPVRCPTQPIQLSLVQSVVDAKSDTTEMQDRSTTALASTLLNQVAPQVQLTLEARNLIDGRLIKSYPLLRERLDPKNVKTDIHVHGDGVFVLHRGILMEVSLAELRKESFPRGPRVDPESGPLILERQRSVRVRYKVQDGTPPFNVIAAAASMSDETNVQSLVQLETNTADSEFEFGLDLETWLRENLAAVADKFDAYFIQSESYDAEGDTTENLRRYMFQRQDQIKTIFARDPAGIPIMIGINIRVTDASDVTCEQQHFVVLEIPANSLVSQIDQARARRRSSSE